MGSSQTEYALQVQDLVPCPNPFQRRVMEETVAFWPWAWLERLIGRCVEGRRGKGWTLGGPGQGRAWEAPCGRLGTQGGLGLRGVRTAPWLERDRASPGVAQASKVPLAGESCLISPWKSGSWNPHS